MVPAALQPKETKVTVPRRPTKLAEYTHQKPVRIGVANRGQVAVYVGIRNSDADPTTGDALMRTNAGNFGFRLEPGEYIDDLFNGPVYVWAASTLVASAIVLVSVAVPVQSSPAVQGVLKPAPGMPGIYNVGAMQRFQDRLMNSAKEYGGTGLGGVDIVNLGDSNTFGYVATQRMMDCWVHMMKLDLQQRWNPTGVQGGFGYANIGWCMTAANQHPGFSKTGTFVSGDEVSGGTASVIARLSASGSLRGNRIALRCNGSDTNAVRNRLNITGADLHYYRNSGQGTSLCYDISTGSAPGASSGGVHATTINATGSYSYQQRSQKTGLTRTADHYLQAGSSTDNENRVQGFTLYDNDESCGVRVHNLGAPSRTIYSFMGDNGFAGGNVDMWCTGSGTGAFYCGLFVVCSGINECGSGSTPTRTAAQYLQDLRDLVARIRNTTNCPTQPSILLISQWCATYDYNPAIWVRSSDLPYEYVEVERLVASENPDLITYDSEPEGMGFSGVQYPTVGTDIAQARGFMYSDGVHFTSKGHRWKAARRVGTLNYGLAA